MACNYHGGYGFKSNCWICKAKQTLKDNVGAIERRDKVIATQAATIEALREENERLRGAITQYTDYWGRGGACQNLTKALLNTSNGE